MVASGKGLRKTSHTEELLDVVEEVEEEDGGGGGGGGGGGLEVCAISGYYLLPSR